MCVWGRGAWRGRQLVCSFHPLHDLYVREWSDHLLWSTLCSSMCQLHDGAWGVLPIVCWWANYLNFSVLHVFLFEVMFPCCLCKDCIFEDRVYSPGDTFHPANDPCQICTCEVWMFYLHPSIHPSLNSIHFSFSWCLMESNIWGVIGSCVPVWWTVPRPTSYFQDQIPAVLSAHVSTNPL